MRTYWAVAALGILAACASQPGPGPVNVNLNGFPPAFKEGYADGCSSAMGSYARNDKRFRSDPQYGQGWRDGLDICGRQSRAR